MKFDNDDDDDDEEEEEEEEEEDVFTSPTTSLRMKNLLKSHIFWSKNVISNMPPLYKYIMPSEAKHASKIPEKNTLVQISSNPERNKDISLSINENKFKRSFSNCIMFFSRNFSYIT